MCELRRGLSAAFLHEELEQYNMLGDASKEQIRIREG